MVEMQTSVQQMRVSILISRTDLGVFYTPTSHEKANRHVPGKRLHVVHVFKMHESRERIPSAFHVLHDLDTIAS